MKENVKNNVMHMQAQGISFWAWIVADVLDFIKEEDNYTSKLKKFKYTELK